jgi:excisionase family DNA binding protein
VPSRPASKQIDCGQQSLGVTTMEQLLTVSEAAAVLGTTSRFPRRLIAERRIRYVRVGRHVRIPVTAVKSSSQRAQSSRSR